MPTDQKINRILKWYYFGVSITNTIIYPIVKLKEFAQLQVGEIEDSLEELIDDKKLPTDEIMNELDYSDAIDDIPTKFGMVNGIITIVYYINKLNLGFKMLAKIYDLDNEKNVMKVLGMNVTKAGLKIIKYVVIAIVIVLFIIGWFPWGKKVLGGLKEFFKNVNVE